MKFSNIFYLSLCLLISSCGSGGGDVVSTDLPRSDVRQVSSLFPYRSNSPYKDELAVCAQAGSAEEGCLLGRLPLIGQSGATVTREDVMNRLLVTHGWMGARFQMLLQDAPDDLIELFGSVAVISIGSTVRPSYYSTHTAGIRLDPVYLWETLEEKANISVAEDYRAGYGKELNFWSMRSSRINGESAYPVHNLVSYEERSLADLKIPFYSLMYHELAHAVDFVPKEHITQLDASLNPSAAIADLEQFRASLQLMQDSPLLSVEMSYLALVQYRGYEATDQQKSYTPSDVGAFMSSDGAMKYYSYATEREDYANLLESSMMKKHFNVDLLIGYAAKPVNENDYSCSDLTVGWGQHNRLSDPLVWPRAKWVVEKVYGQSAETDSLFSNQVGLSREMTPGLDWCQNRDGTVTAASDRSIDKSHTDAAEMEQLRYERQHRYH